LDDETKPQGNWVENGANKKKLDHGYFVVSYRKNK
jgi:hypothetical protein